MSFVTISNTVPVAATFNAAGVGRYINAASVFGGVVDYYQISPSRKIKSVKDPLSTGYTFGITRYNEVDVTVNGVVRRSAARIRTIIELDEIFPLSSVDGMQRQLDEFVTTSNMTRILAGEV